MLCEAPQGKRIRRSGPRHRSKGANPQPRGRGRYSNGMSQSRVGSLLASIIAAIVALAPAFAQEVGGAPPASDDITSAPPAHPLDSRRLRSLFLDLLGRP